MIDVDALHREALAELGAAAPDRAWLRAAVRRGAPLAADSEVEAAVDGVLARRGSLGPLAPLLAEPDVTDVLVNGDGSVWVERAGHLRRADLRVGPDAAMALVEQIVGPIGRRADRSSPWADARLPDGSRAHVVVPPIAVDGPCISIRRFGARPIALAAWAGPEVVALLRWAVAARANIVVSGATGAGKTTLLRALAAELPVHERTITVEDAAELQLPGDHVVRLEARPGGAEGTGGATLRDLVRCALRMRPDRIVVGEVRGGEAVDLLAAMGTGHDGTLTTVHAAGGDDALRRLELLVLQGDLALPLTAIRAHLAAAVDLVVHVARDAGGRRRVCAVDEVVDGRSTSSRRLADDRSVLALPERGRRAPWAPPADPAWLGR